MPTFPQQLMTVSVKLQRSFSANDRGLRRGLNARRNYPGSPCCTFDARDPLHGLFKQQMKKLIYAFFPSNCIKTIIKNEKPTHTHTQMQSGVEREIEVLKCRSRTLLSFECKPRFLPSANSFRLMDVSRADCAHLLPLS